MYSVTDDESLEYIKQTMEDIKRVKKTSTISDVPCVLVANKFDLLATPTTISQQAQQQQKQTSKVEMTQQQQEAELKQQQEAQELEAQRLLKHNELRTVAHELGIKFTETSVKLGTNVDNVFKEVAQMTLQKRAYDGKKQQQKDSCHIGHLHNSKDQPPSGKCSIM